MQRLSDLENSKGYFEGRISTCYRMALKHANEMAEFHRRFLEAEAEQNEIIKSLHHLLEPPIVGVDPEVLEETHKHDTPRRSRAEAEKWREMLMGLLTQNGGTMRFEDISKVTQTPIKNCYGMVYRLAETGKVVARNGFVRLSEQPAETTDLQLPPDMPASDFRQLIHSAIDKIAVDLEAGRPINSTMARKQLSLRLWNYIRGFLTHFPEPPLLVHDDKKFLVYTDKDPELRRVKVKETLAVLRKYTDPDVVFAGKFRARDTGRELAQKLLFKP